MDTGAEQATEDPRVAAPRSEDEALNGLGEENEMQANIAGS